MFIPREAERKLERSLQSGKIIILLGARQTGKTTLLSRLIGKTGGLVLNLDVEADKSRLLVAKDLPPDEALRSLGSPKILVIDEAQRLPEIGRIVKGWFDSDVKAKIILSGSSSLNLLDQSAEALTGRNEKVFLPPLLFREIVNALSVPSHEAMKGTINSLMLESLIFGSYPEVVVSGDKEKYLLNLVSDYLLKDVLQLGLVKNPDLIKRLLTLLAFQIGSLVSTLELANNLAVSRQTVERYLDLLERTFVIFRLNAYSTNLRKEIAKSKKIYFWDTGVRNAILKEFSVSEHRGDIGALWENWIIAEFAKENMLNGGLSDLYFWRSRDGAEVDLVTKKGAKIRAFEIKWVTDRIKKANAFNSRYRVSPSVLNKANFWRFLLNSQLAKTK